MGYDREESREVSRGQIIHGKRGFVSTVMRFHLQGLKKGNKMQQYLPIFMGGPQSSENQE